MSPFRESAKMAAPPLNKFPCSMTAPPLPQTTAQALTSLPSPFYKSNCSPRLGAVPSFPWPAWQFGPAIKLCSMDARLFSWTFFVSGVFPNSYHLWTWMQNTEKADVNCAATDSCCLHAHLLHKNPIERSGLSGPLLAGCPSSAPSCLPVTWAAVIANL
jgi:hypothetical protein